MSRGVANNQSKEAHLYIVKTFCILSGICNLNISLVYVDASESCNELGIIIGSNANLDWVIQISQIGCDFENLAPSGCTQWLSGGGGGVVRTYNYAGRLHLAQQNQNICVR